MMLWAVDLEYPETAGVTGPLFLCSAFLSAPAFLIVFVSERWHRRVMWLVAALSFVMNWFAIFYRWSDGDFRMDQALSALRVTSQPLVVLSFLVAVLVEIAFRLRHHGDPSRG